MYPMFKKSDLVGMHQIHGPYPKIDDRDIAIATSRLKSFDEDPTPRVGDFVIMPDGSYERFSYDWYDAIQTCFSGSFYLGNGYASMSGALNNGIPYDHLEITLDQKIGHFWLFHHNDHCADNGIGLSALCRVYRVI